LSLETIPGDGHSTWTGAMPRITIGGAIISLPASPSPRGRFASKIARLKSSASLRPCGYAVHLMRRSLVSPCRRNGSRGKI